MAVPGRLHGGYLTVTSLSHRRSAGAAFVGDSLIRQLAVAFLTVLHPRMEVCVTN